MQNIYLFINFVIIILLYLPLHSVRYNSVVKTTREIITRTITITGSTTHSSFFLAFHDLLGCSDSSSL